MTDRRCKILIDEFGVDRNAMSGVPGNFYTTNRPEDLKTVIQDIFLERKTEMKVKKRFEYVVFDSNNTFYGLEEKLNAKGNEGFEFVVCLDSIVSKRIIMKKEVYDD